MRKIRKIKFYQIWMLAALVAVFLSAGCACEDNSCSDDSDGGTTVLNRPTVIFTTPFDTEDGVLINKHVAATFSQAMIDASIDVESFTVTGPGVTLEPGTVSYDPVTHIALFESTSDLLPDTTYMATITLGAKNTHGNSMLDPYVWIFNTGETADTQNPTIILENPANLSTGVPLNSNVTAAFSETMDPDTLTLATFTLRQGLTVIPGSTVTYSGLVATFIPLAPLNPNLVYTAEISSAATDLVGNPLVAGSKPNPWSFSTIEVTNPFVTFEAPFNGETGVALDTNVNAIFSKQMNPTTITLATFTLRQGLTVIPGSTVTYSGMTATFIPLAPLDPNLVYTAQISSAARDLNGNQLVAGPKPNPWSFTTLAVTNPFVTFETPFNGETGVSVDTNVNAVFSKEMDPTTVTLATFTLLQGSTIIPGSTVTYAGLTATFIPLAPLLPNQVYTAQISSAATDLDGNPLVAGLKPNPWSFSTFAASNPYVTFETPFDAETGVPVDTNVNAIFSKEMDPTTVTLATFTLSQGSTVIPGSTVTMVGTIATFIPLAPLDPDTEYTAEVSNAATDLDGNPLVAGLAPNPWSFTTIGADNPTVVLTVPADQAFGVNVNSAVTATFSTAMDPLTLQLPGAFTLKQGSTVIDGSVSYSGLMATFFPYSPLDPLTEYTAEISNVVTDLAGNPLVPGIVPNPWVFFTGTGPAGIDLGAVENFAIIAGGGISSVPTSNITGDIGVSPATGAAISGFSQPLTCPEVTGTVYAVDAAGPACALIDPAGLTAAKAALTAAYNTAEGATAPAPATVSGDQGGLTLPPGIYKSTSTLLIQSGNLTLDGQGDPNAVWIFQIASTLTTIGCGASVPCTTGGNVMLTNGANAANIFWQVGSAATIGQYTLFNGTIMAYDDISIGTGAEIHGRLLSGAQPSGAGAVTLISDTIIIP